MQPSASMADEQPAVEQHPAQAPPPPKDSRLKRFLHGKNGWFSKFARQDLPGWTPILSANFVVTVYMLAGIVLLPLGIAILVASLNVQEHRVRHHVAALIVRPSMALCATAPWQMASERRALTPTVWCPQVRYDNAGIFGSLQNNTARVEELTKRKGAGDSVVVNVVPDKTMKPPVSCLPA